MLRTQSFFIPMCAFERSEKGMIFFMKKYVLGVTAILMLVSLVGCGEKKVSENTNIIDKPNEVQVVYQDADTRYQEYLKNLKQSMEKEFSSLDDIENPDWNVVDFTYDYVEPFSPNTVHHLTINRQFELLVNGKIMAENVLRAYAAYEGNGAAGFSVYFITDDGKLYFCGVGKDQELTKISDSFPESWRYKNEIHPLELKNVVDFMEVSTSSGHSVCFVDIDGNILY